MPRWSHWARRRFRRRRISASPTSEGGFIAGFVNDVEESAVFTDNGTFNLETDSDGGGFISGAWEFRDSMHMFGEYSSAGQELEISDGINTGEGDFDLVRWRIGVGYAYPYSPTASFYGRLTFDSIEIKDVGGRRFRS